MKVRFKLDYSIPTSERLSYELVDDEFVLAPDKETFTMKNHYNTKILGLILAHLMEEADGTEIDALDVLVKANQ